MIRLSPLLLLLAGACGTPTNTLSDADNQSRESGTTDDAEFSCDDVFDECVDQITAQGGPAELCDDVFLACTDDSWDDSETWDEGDDTWGDDGDFGPPSEDDCLELYGECQDAAAEYGADPSECDDFLDFCLTATPFPEDSGPFPGDDGHGDCPEPPSEEECLDLYGECEAFAAETGEDPAICDEFLVFCLDDFADGFPGDDFPGDKSSGDDWGTPTAEECDLIHAECLAADVPEQECDEFLAYCQMSASEGDAPPPGL